MSTTEKKRVTILVDANQGSSGTHAGEHNVFNFGGFQPQAGATSSENANCRGRGGGGDDDDAVTSYQGGRKSIMEGVGAADLLHMHRKSLAQLGGNTTQGGAQMDQFSGVTLSRRHRVSQTEYDEGRDERTAQELEGFSFGTAE